MGLNRPTALPAELQVNIWERKLRQEALLHDPFTSLQGVHSTERRVSIDNEIYLVLEDGGNNARTKTITLQKALSGRPTEGSTASPLGGEEELDQKVMDLHYTDVSHAVALQNFGIDKLTKDYWGIFDQITPLLAQWARELEGKYIREALLERYSSNLVQAPHFLTQEFSPNIAVAGTAVSAWPDFSAAGATHVNAIGDALTAAGLGASACATPRFIQLVEEWATSEKTIEPVYIDGKETYLIVLPSPQARYLKDPAVSGNMGDIYQRQNGLSQTEMQFPGVITRIGRCLICEDPRYPTLSLGGSAGAYSLTARYKLPGRGPNSDPRDKTASARQVGYLLGKGALTKWMPEPWHWQWEFEDYDKFGGKGIFASCGYEMVQWDFGDSNTANPPTDNTRQQDSSAVLLFANPPALT